MKPVLLLLLASLVWGAPNPTKICPPRLSGIYIYRDTYGVPHVYAKTDAGAAFGLMYAQAEDNFWQLEEDQIYMLGRAAEIHGPAGLSGDILARAWESESLRARRSSSQYPQQRVPVEQADVATKIQWQPGQHREVAREI
jgi:penicillin amidase